MKEFNNFDAFSKHIEKVVKEYPEREYKTLNFIGKIIEEDAKITIGHLQSGAGLFATWAPLAESTKRDKERQGYVFNAEYNPLYRTGELKESIHHVVNRTSHTVYVGSPLDIALYQEMGTKHIPARSFLGLSLFKAKYEIQWILGNFLLYWITNQNTSIKRKTHGSI